MGIKHVNKLDGPMEQKKRLRVILESLTGQITVSSACRKLGIGETQFNNLRNQVLQGGLDALAPGMPGRPHKSEPADPARIAQLEQQVSDLSIELEASMIRTEIAMLMPDLIKLPADPKQLKKTR